MAIDISVIKEMLKKDPRNVRRLDDLASRLMIHPETLRKALWRNWQLNFSDLWNDAAEEKMKELLLTMDDQCKYISLQVGFRDDVGPRFFKRRTGMTMVEFRLTMRHTVVPQGVDDTKKGNGSRPARANRQNQPSKSTSRVNL